MVEAETQIMGGRMRARWTRLAVLGLLMETLAPLLLFTAGLVFGLDVGGEAGFFLIPPAVSLLGALLVWRFGWWAKILGLIAAVVPAMGFFWTAFAITLVGSFFEFVAAILLIPGAVIAIVSCVAALVAGRRRRFTPTATGGERIAIRAIVGLVVVLAVVSGILTFAGRSSVSDAAAADQTISMKDFEFKPEDFEVEGGDSLLVRNDDPFVHTFTIDELGIDVSFTPGDEVLIRIPDKPGTYVVYCRPHTGDPDNPDEDDMAGTITVD